MNELQRRLATQPALMPVRIYRSNRLETLVTLLGDIVSQPLSHPFAKETIVVSSLGMQRWIVSELTRRFGVWTNAEHPLPRAFVERVLRARAESTSFDPWDREHLPFAVADFLADESRIQQWPKLKEYLQGTTRSERSFELADKIADTFDQYLVYRPDWIQGWLHGSSISPLDDDWQPALFRQLAEELGPAHFAHRLDETLKQLREEEPSLDGLPERLCCFQVGLLPPSYLRLVQALGRHIPVHFFVLSPSRAYLEYTRSQRHRVTGVSCRETSTPALSAMERPRTSGRRGSTTAQLTFDFASAKPRERPPDPRAAAANEPWENQPLFASLCRQARQLESILGELENAEIGQEPFVEGEPKTLLEFVQSDIAALRHRRPAGSVEPIVLSPDDRSISIHACHSRRREIECLRELLLDQLDRDESLSPEDILVMLVDIDEYAPLVDALFGRRPGDEASPGLRRPAIGYLPYTIADRSAISYNGLADSLLRLLDLFAERMTFSRFMDMVSLERLQAKFGILPDKISIIERWLYKLRFAWGVDGVDRKAAGAPEVEEHTLRFGLHRLLLGVALDSSEAPVYGDRAPLDVEGEEAELAGRLAELCATCFEYRQRLTQEQSIESYVRVVRGLLDDVFAVDRDSAWQRTEICDRLHEFARLADEAHFGRNLSFYSLRRELKSRLDAVPSARSFLSGGVTFCKMLPLRSIPFRVIAMVGLDDDQFPRRERRSSFNALDRDSRAGDRRVSDEDRYLFAETLLACRERLILTYVGRSSRDDSALPPSVVVEELLNTIEESCTVPESTRGVREHVVHVEALQPFSPRYFDGSRPDLVNRSEAHYRAALALHSERRAIGTPDYSSYSLPKVDRVAMKELVSLLRDPSRVFLDSALHVARDLVYEVRDGIEPVTLDGLAQWQVTHELLRARQKGESETAVQRRLRAAGELPVLGLGDVTFDTLRSRAESLHAAAARFCQGPPTADRWVSVEIGDVRVEGWLESTWPSAHLSLSPSRFSVKRVVEAWIEHLCLNASGFALPTAIVTRSADGDRVETRLVEALEEAQAKRYLAELVGDYRLAQALPLPFWLDPAYAYQKPRNRGPTEHTLRLEVAFDQMEKKRDAGDLPSQFDSLYGDNPLADDWPTRAGVPGVLSFAKWAERWLGPIFEHMSEADADEATSDYEAGR